MVSLIYLEHMKFNNIFYNLPFHDTGGYLNVISPNYELNAFSYEIFKQIKDLLNYRNIYLKYQIIELMRSGDN